MELPLLSILFGLIIAGLVFYLVIWMVDYIGLPEPFNKVVKVLVALVVVIYLIGILTGYAPRLNLR